MFLHCTLPGPQNFARRNPFKMEKSTWMLSLLEYCSSKWVNSVGQRAGLMVLKDDQFNAPEALYIILRL